MTTAVVCKRLYNRWTCYITFTNNCSCHFFLKHPVCHEKQWNEEHCDIITIPTVTGAQRTDLHV